VRAKAGLNRAILARGWGTMRQRLKTKAEEFGGQLREIDPAYTSQTCPSCGHVSRGNRKTQAQFACTCGFREHADIVGATNILARGLSAGAPPAAGRRGLATGAVPSGLDADRAVEASNKSSREPQVSRKGAPGPRGAKSQARTNCNTERSYPDATRQSFCEVRAMDRNSCGAPMVCGPRVAIRAHGRVVSAKHGSTAFDGEVARRAYESFDRHAHTDEAGATANGSCRQRKKAPADEGLTGAPTAMTRTTSATCLTLFLCPKAYGLFCSQASAEPTAHILGWNYGSADIDAPSPPAAGNRPTRHLAPFAAKANTVTAVANFAVAHSLRRSNCSGPARSSDIVDQLWEPYVRPWNFFMR
jgi:hypothetical protein